MVLKSLVFTYIAKARSAPTSFVQNVFDSVRHIFQRKLRETIF